MHDGAYATLWDVVNHYNFGGATGPYAGAKDPALAPLLLTDAELGDLVEFLRALDDGAAKPTDDFPEGLLHHRSLARHLGAEGGLLGLAQAGGRNDQSATPSSAQGSSAPPQDR